MKSKKNSNYICKIYNNYGVTMIALVLTIIVLIILAGVSITAMTGENGIIKQAKTAKVKTDEGAKNELNDLLEVKDEYENGSSWGDVGNDITPDPGYDDPLQDGSASHPFVILTVEDLVRTLEKFPVHDKPYPDYHYKLFRDLNLKNKRCYNNPDTTEFGDINKDGKTQVLFDELNDRASNGFHNAYSFHGVFDGNGNTISNIWMNDVLNDDEDYFLALFQENYGEIKNLTIHGDFNAHIGGKRSIYSYVGSIVGYNRGKIINCTNKANINVNGNDFEYDFQCPVIRIGGIASSNRGIIDRCVNEGNVNTNFNIKMIPNPTATVDKYDRIIVGGIVGYSYDTVSNCINKGNVTLIKDTNAPLNLDNKIYFGGINAVASSDVAKNQTPKIYNVINLGKLYCESKTNRIKVGGIISDYPRDNVTNIENAYNAGEITGKTVNSCEFGGCFGEGYGNITNAYNTGRLSCNLVSDYRFGAIIGDGHNSATGIVNCKFNQVDNLKGSGDANTPYIVGVPGLTMNKVIDEMNQNVRNHNSTSESKWCEWVINNGTINIK